MKVNLLQAAHLGAKDYKKGIQELPDELKSDDFFKALSKAGKLFLISSVEVKDEEVKDEEEKATKKRGRKPATDKAPAEEIPLPEKAAEKAAEKAD